MRPILVSIIAAVGLVWGGSLPLVSMAGQAEHPTHQQLTTTVEKIESGLMYFKATASLEHHVVRVHKALIDEAHAGRVSTE